MDSYACIDNYLGESMWNKASNILHLVGTSSEVDNSGGIGYPFLGCVQGEDLLAWDRRYGQVANSFIGAEKCASKCKEGGYKYWGLECPSSAEMFCQCGSEGILNSATFFDDVRSKEFNNETPWHSHCNGPFQSSMNGVEYLHGAAMISSAYRTDKPGRRSHLVT